MRNTRTVTVKKEGRDFGKRFFITEMSATKGDAWATRLIMAMVDAGVDLPEDIYTTGMAGVAAVGFKSLLTIKFSVAQELLAEMIACVKIKPDKNNPEFDRDLIEDDIEEVSTLLWLRSEVFELHTGFSIAGALSRLISLLPEEVTSSMSTSTPSSELSSAADLPPLTN